MSTESTQNKTPAAGAKQKKAKSAGRGRPEGAKNIATVVTVETSRCPVCQSTERSEYFGRTEQEYAGLENDRPYTHIVRRRTRCTDCGQLRIDRTFENRADSAPDPVSEK